MYMYPSEITLFHALPQPSYHSKCATYKEYDMLRVFFFLNMYMLKNLKVR